jgi:hypothetical protein
MLMPVNDLVALLNETSCPGATCRNSFASLLGSRLTSVLKSKSCEVQPLNVEVIPDILKSCFAAIIKRRNSSRSFHAYKARINTNFTR